MCSYRAAIVQLVAHSPALFSLTLPQVGSEPINVAALEEAAGVGVEVGPQQIQEVVAACVKENEAKLKEER